MVPAAAGCGSSASKRDCLEKNRSLSNINLTRPEAPKMKSFAERTSSAKKKF